MMDQEQINAMMFNMMLDHEFARLHPPHIISGELIMLRTASAEFPYTFEYQVITPEEFYKRPWIGYRIWAKIRGWIRGK